jgi:hypothetical protein
LSRVRDVRLFRGRGLALPLPPQDLRLGRKYAAPSEVEARRASQLAVTMPLLAFVGHQRVLGVEDESVD